MNWGILAFVIIYEVLTVVGVGLVIARKNKHSVEEGNFALAGKGLPTAQVGVTLALTMLGSAHIWGTCENAYSMGSIATWFGIACTVMMIVITQITGPWVRKIGTDTMPDLFGKLYGKKMRILCACVMGPLVFGCLCLETQCIAVTFVACTGWSLHRRCNRRRSVRYPLCTARRYERSILAEYDQCGIYVCSTDHRTDRNVCIPSG